MCGSYVWVQNVQKSVFLSQHRQFHSTFCPSQIPCPLKIYLSCLFSWERNRHKFIFYYNHSFEVILHLKGSLKNTASKYRSVHRKNLCYYEHAVLISKSFFLKIYYFSWYLQVFQICCNCVFFSLCSEFSICSLLTGFQLNYS